MYKVLSPKPVEVKIGTLEESTLTVFQRGQTFETAPEFVVDLIAMGAVKEVVKPAATAQPAKKKTTEGEK